MCMSLFCLSLLFRSKLAMPFDSLCNQIICLFAAPVRSDCVLKVLEFWSEVCCILQSSAHLLWKQFECFLLYETFFLFGLAFLSNSIILRLSQYFAFNFLSCRRSMFPRQRTDSYTRTISPAASSQRKLVASWQPRSEDILANAGYFTKP